MSFNLVDLVKGQLGSALVSQAANQFEESESGISKTIGGLLPVVLGGLANNSSNTKVLDAITGSANGTGFLGDILNSSTSPIITTLLTSIFGDKVGDLVNVVSSYAGVKRSTVDSLLGTVTAAALRTVGKVAHERNLDRSGISALLSEQKGIVSSLLPAGLSLGALGLGNLFSGSTTVKTDNVEFARKEEVRRTEVREEKGGSSILKWLLPLLLLLLGGWFAMKQCGKKPATAPATTQDTVKVEGDSVVTTTTVTREIQEIDLNGVKLRGYANGLEYQIIEFLKNGGYTSAADDAALKDKWYSFDNVNFKMGSATELEEGSKGQIENLAAILKAYPDAKIKIGGYTDKTGNEELNKKLSTDRALFIKSELEKLGVGAQVISAEGYGSEFATVPAEASDAERAIDRKMAVRFTK